ncbi:hypothetical protein JCM10296v2_000306 [Rhodotorula toruloides]
MVAALEELVDGESDEGGEGLLSDDEDSEEDADEESTSRKGKAKKGKGTKGQARRLGKEQQAARPKVDRLDADAGRRVKERVAGGGVANTHDRPLPAFPPVSPDDTDFYAGGNYLKAGPPLIADGGCGIVNINAGLQALAEGKAVGRDRRGRDFRGHVMVAPVSEMQVEGFAYPLYRIPPPQAYVGSGDGVDGLGGRILQHERPKSTRDDPQATAIAARGHSSFIVPVEAAQQLSSDPQVQYWRLTLVNKAYSRSMTVLMEHILSRMLHLLDRTLSVLDVTAYLLKTPVTNLPFQPLDPRKPFLALNVAFPLGGYLARGEKQVKRIITACKEGQITTVLVRLLPTTRPYDPAARMRGWTVKLDGAVLAQALGLELAEPGTLGQLRIKLAVKGGYEFTDTSGAYNVSPAILGGGKKILKDWAIQMFLDLHNERREGLTFKTVGLPEEFAEKAKKPAEELEKNPPAPPPALTDYEHTHKQSLKVREKEIGEAWGSTLRLNTTSKNRDTDYRKFAAQPLGEAPNITLIVYPFGSITTVPELDEVGDIWLMLDDPANEEEERRWSGTFSKRQQEKFTLREICVRGQDGVTQLEGRLLRLLRDLKLWEVELAARAAERAEDKAREQEE